MRQKQLFKKLKKSSLKTIRCKLWLWTVEFFPHSVEYEVWMLFKVPQNRLNNTLHHKLFFLYIR